MDKNWHGYNISTRKNKEEQVTGFAGMLEPESTDHKKFYQL